MDVDGVLKGSNAEKYKAKPQRSQVLDVLQLEKRAQHIVVLPSTGVLYPKPKGNNENE
tara:strand:- start:170 stop:343 length:174 start_codon:yes stop_codon:yes gene_type:complete